MLTMFRYTNSNMSGWEFVKLHQHIDENSIGGFFTYGNTAATAENFYQYDLDVTVKSRSELRAIREKLITIGYEDRGRL